MRTWPQACTGSVLPVTPMLSKPRGPWSGPNIRTETLGEPPPCLHTSHWSPSSGNPKHPHAGPPATVLCPGPKERPAPQPPADGPGPKQIVPAGGWSGRQDTLLQLAGLQDASAGRLEAPPLTLPEPGFLVCTPVTMGPRWERTGHMLRAGETSER